MKEQTECPNCHQSLSRFLPLRQWQPKKVVDGFMKWKLGFVCPHCHVVLEYKWLDIKKVLLFVVLPQIVFMSPRIMQENPKGAYIYALLLLGQLLAAFIFQLYAKNIYKVAKQ